MSDCTPDDPWMFVCGFDYARGGTSPDSRAGDDAAWSVLRFRMKGPMEYVWAHRACGIKTNQASMLTHKLNNRFKFSVIMSDPGGGGILVRDDLRRAEQDDDSGEKLSVVPIVTADDALVSGQQILAFFKRGDPFIARLGIGFAFESTLLSKAHEELRTSIETGQLLSPVEWPGFVECGLGGAGVDPDKLRDFLDSKKGLSESDLAHATIHLATTQLMNVTRDKDKDGQVSAGAHGDYSWGSKRKKDVAYSLLYAHFAAHIIREERSLSEQESGQDNAAGDVPIVVTNMMP